MIGSGFSVSRAISYAKLFNPYIGWQMALYPLVSIAEASACIMLGFSVWGVMLSSLLGIVFSLMVYFGPMVFAIGSNQILETLVPARWDEKALVVVLFSLVVLPLLVFVPSKLVFLIANYFINDNSANFYMELYSTKMSCTYIVWSYIQSIVPTVACMLAVVSYTHHRMLLGAVWAVVSMLAEMLLGLIVGVYIAFCVAPGSEYESVKSAKGMIQSDILLTLMNDINPVLWIAIVLGVVYFGVMVWLTCRKIKNRQI